MIANTTLSDETPFTEEEELYRNTVRRFIEREIEPRYLDITPHSDDKRALWRKAAAAGILGGWIPEEFGGPGASTLCNVILSYELSRSPVYATLGSLFTTDLAGSVLLEGKAHALLHKWAPKILAGEVVQCFAMTETEAGSDAVAIRSTAVRDGDEYVINGSKVYITNGDWADLIFITVKTDPSAPGARGMSVILVEADRPGITRRGTKTLGFPGGNTGELHFDNVRVPVDNLVGSEGGAFKMLMANLGTDRLQLAARALGQAELAFDLTLDYVKQRKVFGQTLFDFQNTQFKLAEAKTEIEAGRAFLHSTVRKVRAGTCTDMDGAMVKLWLCEMSDRVVDTCLQLWGGAGYMDEMPISRIYTSNRVLRIYGGTSEIMKLIIARKL
ncbi:acyl-CoA dehydrogenase family protein [Noviherbaspirillum sedimenti]|uniref:Acyl-[acyl-carrier-protein] dehydrogenase MbtN n=1 Tax=Noviherbaspirillum sedimenti TaxID=2320865 RepID=A0A3A3G566_9BURK|nr:acyl-CoA dehydrogenase family protein [Noviherbaspirillum sedimenti]RJG03081.1 acyl-CoA dehydrogenase [Noviherbaspirillum sedimenti]